MVYSNYTLNLVPILPTPTFSPVAGAYAGDQSVTISCTVSGARIYYTTDGSTPDETDTLFTTAITVSMGTTVKAIAFKESYEESSVGSATYTQA